MVQAVERAKQVTMAELNAIIGVRGLSILALILVFVINSLTLFLNFVPSNGQKAEDNKMKLNTLPSISKLWHPFIPI